MEHSPTYVTALTKYERRMAKWRLKRWKKVRNVAVLVIAGYALLFLSFWGIFGLIDYLTTLYT